MPELEDSQLPVSEPVTGSTPAAADPDNPTTNPDGTPVEDDRLTTLEKRFKDTQVKLTQMGQENASLRGKVEVFESQAVAPAEPRTDPLSELDEDEVLTNPMLIADAMRSDRDNLIQDVAVTIRSVRDELLSEIAEMNPERIKYRSAIDQLREDPELAGFGDSALTVIAKREQKLKPAQPLRGERPNGVPASGSQAAHTAPAAADVKKSPLFNLIYGDRFTKES